MEQNREKSTDLKTMMNYPRPGRKARFGKDGVIAREVNRRGDIKPAITNMTPKERKEYGRQPAPKD